jgi:glucose/arabinose dehydrogenase
VRNQEDEKMFGKFYFAVCLLMLAACGSSDGKPVNNPQSKINLSPVFPELDFSRPILMLQKPAGDDWYVLEQSGPIYRIDARTQERSLLLNLNQFYDISSCNECGLLGMAFHPEFAKNGLIYLSFTEGSENALISYVARFRSADGGLSFAFKAGVPERKNILQLAQPYSNHNGGHIAFGPDGFLYFGLGDGGSGNDPRNHGQDAATLLGSMLRLRDDGSAAPGNKVSIGRPEIYAWGLRNPWRWSFDRKTGELWAGDVGQNLYEEVDIIRNGLNYGWRCYEGFHRTENACGETGPLEPPVAEYGREEGVSITGGYVYRGAALPDLEGVYIFGDYGSGRIWGLYPKKDGDYERVLLLASGLNISSFAEDHAGELYVIDHGGDPFKITSSVNSVTEH